MQNLTHEQARHLLKTSADYPLPRNAAIDLRKHLTDCADCNSYASSLEKMENSIKQAMQNRWSVKHQPIRIAALTQARQRQHPLDSFAAALNNKLVFVPALVLTLFVLFNLITPQAFSSSFGDLSLQTPLAAQHTPTATQQPTQTQIPQSPACQKIFYIAQDGDTLESIASKFGTTSAALQSLNGGLEIKTGQTIAVMFCNPGSENTTTPTSTSTSTPQY